MLFWIVVVLTAILYWRWSRVYSYWSQRGVKHPRPMHVLGNVADNFVKRKSFGHVMKDISQQFPSDSYVGFYNYTYPALLINTPQLAESVLIKDFSKFANRGNDMPIEERRPLDRHLFSLNGVSWKAVRSKMSPVFTSSKLKGMLPLMDELFSKSLDEIDSNNGRRINIKNVVELYSVCVRATCVFGKDSSRMDQSSEFIARVRDLSKFDFFRFLGVTMALWFPKIATKLNLSVFGAQNEDYFVDILLKTFRERAERPVAKNDFITTMLELKSKGTVDVKQWTKEDEFLRMNDQLTTSATVVIDDSILMAQAFIFLLAGIDTVVTNNVMALVELAKNPSIQQKARQEVSDVLARHDGQYSYEALKEMVYLEDCIKETLRIYPSVEMVNRVCVQDHMLDDGHRILRGEQIFIPVLAFHTDPKYFPQPDVFRPERFQEDSIPHCAFIPFGEGPRICIGLRFAMMEMKMFMAKMIQNYKFSIDEASTPQPVQFDKWFFLKRIVSPVHLNFTKITH